MVEIGLDRLINNESLQNLCPGKIAYLGHSAALTSELELGLSAVKKIFSERLIKVFGPQHGFVTDVQDNMVETESYHHPYFDLPLYSLYGEHRRPTSEMLEGVDTLIIDLQDVGTRVYTYITTLSYCMEKCAELGIKVVVLDRPNPVGGELIEGPVLQKEWRSFVGHHPIPQRHSLTIGEVAKLQQKIHSPQCELEVITMKGWKRSHHWRDTGLTWVNPSPNLATPESALTFCGTVLYEGTNISEGRGTTRSLEVLGAHGLEPFSFTDLVKEELKNLPLGDYTLRPLQFFPMFQKFKGQACGGFHIHPVTPANFQSWMLGAYLLKLFFKHTDFEWNQKTYEYEEGFAINYINGGDELKNWVEKQGSFEELTHLSQFGHDEFRNLREDILIYS